MGYEGFDRGEVDDARSLERTTPTKDPTSPRVDSDDLPRPVRPGEDDVVGLHEPSADEVDQVAGQQVVREQELSLASLELAHVHPLAVETDPTFRQRADLSSRNEEVSSPESHDNPDDRRMRAVAEPDHHILDATDPVALAVNQRTMDNLRQLHDLGGHLGRSALSGAAGAAPLSTRLARHLSKTQGHAPRETLVRSAGTPQRQRVSQALSAIPLVGEADA